MDKQLTTEPNYEEQDVFQLSKDNLLVVVFAKTTSPYFALAINIAQGATSYSERTIDKSPVYTCVFGRSAEQAARVIALLRYVDSWATKQLFVAGRLVTQPTATIIETLNCYQTGSCCTNTDAHCLQISENPFQQPFQSNGGMGFSISLKVDEIQLSKPKQKKFIFPCKIAFSCDRLSREHPANWEDQVQAITVKKSVDWCPLLDLTKFRQFD